MNAGDPDNSASTAVRACASAGHDHEERSWTLSQDSVSDAVTPSSDVAAEPKAYGWISYGAKCQNYVSISKFKENEGKQNQDLLQYGDANSAVIRSYPRGVFLMKNS